MSQPSAHVTAAEISRIAGVTRATVSNWRRRHDDFPAPAAGTDSSPLYDLAAVRDWLQARGQASASTPSEELRTTLRMHADSGATAARLLAFVLAATRFGSEAATDLDGLSDTDLAEHATRAVASLSDAVPGTEGVKYHAANGGVLRAVLHCVRGDGPQAALDVLAERELEDSASSGTYVTPQQLADLMARLLGRPEVPYPERVFDPACGSGALLAAAAERGASEVAGQDRLLVQVQRSAVRLLLAFPGLNVTTRVGDSLRNDAFTDLIADGALCNPPYGDRDWGHDELAYDPRWESGVPPRGEPELAWVQHALAHLAPGGLAVMLLPPATASRSSGRRIRSDLLRRGALRAVIALPPGTAAPLHIGLHLWVLQRPAPGDGGQEHVLFVDTAREPVSQPAPGPGRSAGRRGPVDWESVTTTTLQQWHAFAENPEGFTDRPGTARAMPVIDLLDEFVDVTPARHIRAAPASSDPATMACEAKELTRRLAENIAALAGVAELNDWPSAGDAARSWRTATVADLARGGALTLRRAVRSSQDADLPPEHARSAVLTVGDLTAGAPASGQASDMRAVPVVVIEAGDVVLTSVLGPHKARSRVADERDAGCLLGPHLHLLRPDTTRLDPWFLAGFLSTPDNVSAASFGSSPVHLDARRLRVPLLPLDEQCRYGQAFRRIHELRTAADQVKRMAAETADTLSTGLTAGALLPPDSESSQ